MTPVETVLDLYRRRGAGVYFGEAVTQIEHALQTAHLADAAGAPSALIIAALLHDIGHLVHQHGEDVADRGVDAQHERIGAKWLARWFDARVTEPILLHVDAKRYWSATDPEYAAQLSPASQQSLSLQGGAFDAATLREFEQQPFARDALSLRRWDDRAKVVGQLVPPIEQYAERMASLLVR